MVVRLVLSFHWQIVSEELQLCQDIAIHILYIVSNLYTADNEAAKKMVRPLSGWGGGVKGWAIKEKRRFLKTKKVPMVIKLEGGGG